MVEQTIINNLAAQIRSIAGVKNAYDFAQNPDNLTSAMLPALLMYPSEFTSETKGHRNLWRNEIVIRGILYVADRQSRGGSLKFLENAAMPFGFLFRQRFQTASVIEGLLGTDTGVTEAFLRSGNYGAGGALLTHNSKEYIGWVFNWRFKEIV